MHYVANWSSSDPWYFEGVNGTFLKLAERRRPENGKTGSSQLAKDGHFAEVNWIVVDSQ